MGISDKVKKLLYFECGGYCENPSCNCNLSRFFESGAVTNIEELAHIIGQSEKGPRGKEGKPLRERDEYENIILLCPTCHTLIDKNPIEYPVSLLLEWKRKHKEKIAANFVVPIYDSREKLSQIVHSILRQNKALFDAYGPFSAERDNPLSDAVKLWDCKCVETVIPNNRRIAKLLTANEHLLTEEEKMTLDKFIIHIEAFERNKLSGDKNSYAPIFPIEMNQILLKGGKDNA